MCHHTVHYQKQVRSDLLHQKSKQKKDTQQLPELTTAVVTINALNSTETADNISLDKEAEEKGVKLLSLFTEPHNLVA
jgi:hypothetical protein